MTSFFYVVSIAFHESVPALRNCMDTSRKIYIYWLRAQPLLHRLLHRFFGPERLASHRLFWAVQRHESHWGEGGRSSAYGGCGRHSKDRSWIIATVERAVWGRALSCWSKTPVLRRPRCLDLIAGSRWFFRRSAYVSLVTVFPLGHVVLQNYRSFIPKESQHNLSSRWLCAEFFQFWRGDMAPFLARFLGFRLAVMDPGFISRNNYS